MKTWTIFVLIIGFLIGYVVGGINGYFVGEKEGAKEHNKIFNVDVLRIQQQVTVTNTLSTSNQYLIQASNMVHQINLLKPCFSAWAEDEIRRIAREEIEKAKTSGITITTEHFFKDSERALREHGTNILNGLNSAEITP